MSELDFLFWITFFNLIVAILNFSFAQLRTYFNWRTLVESREYWKSWKKRQLDVAKKVIESLSEDEIIKLAAEIEKERKRRKKIGKSRRIKAKRKKNLKENKRTKE